MNYIIIKSFVLQIYYLYNNNIWPPRLRPELYNYIIEY